MSTGITKEKFIPGADAIKSELESIRKQFADIAIAVEKIATKSTEIGKNVGTGNSLKGIISESKELAAAEKQLADEQKKLNDLNSQSLKIHTAIQQKKIVEQKKAEAASEKQLNTQTKRTVQDKKQLIIAMNAEKNSITQLSAMNKVLEARMKQLNVSIPAQKMQFDNLSKAVLRNQSVLQKNVVDIRNARSGFNGLTFQVSQLARELPALAYGPQMFIAAISNNFPMLQDEIKKVRIQNDLLRKSGQHTIPVWKQMMGAIFSFQTALIVLITAYMMFSKEINAFLGTIFKTTKAINATKIATEALSSSMANAAKDTAANTTELKLLYDASQDVSKTEEERYAAINKMQELYPNYLGNIDDETIYLGKASEIYKQLTKDILANARAKVLLNKVSELEAKVAEEEFGNLEDNRKGYFELFEESMALKEKIDAEIRKGATSTTATGMGYSTQSQLGLLEEQKRKVDRALKSRLDAIGEYRNAINRIVSNIDVDDLYLLENDKTKKEREKSSNWILDFLKQRQAQEIEIIRQGQENQIKQSGLIGDQLRVAREKNEIKILNVEMQFLQEQLQLVKENGLEYNEILADIESKRTEIKEKENDFRAKSEEEYQKYILELAKQNSDTLVSQVYSEADRIKRIASQSTLTAISEKKRSNREIERLQRELALHEIQVEIDAAKKIIESLYVTEEERAKQIERLEQLYKQFYDKLIDNSKQSDQDQLEIWREFASGMADIIGEVAGLFDALQERQLQNAKELYEAQIRYAGTSVEKRLLAEKQYEKEQAKIKKRMAIAEKAEALFNIAMRIAELAPKAAAGDVGSILGIIAGGIATGTVLATGIPAYEKGTGHAESTFIAGEAGTEAIIKDGKVILTPNKATLFNDPALSGATVLPHDETQRMLANYALRQSYDMIDLSSTNKHLKSIDKNTKSQQSVTFDSKGRKILKRGYITTVIT